MDENKATENIDNTNIMSHDQYNKVLSQTMSSIKYCLVLGVVYAFFHTYRVSIYYLYAKEFNPESYQLYLLIYGFPVWAGFASVIYSSLGNKYGYDFMLNILCLFKCIGVLLESFATNFWILFLGVMINQVVFILAKIKFTLNAIRYDK